METLNKIIVKSDKENGKRKLQEKGKKESGKSGSGIREKKH